MLFNSYIFILIFLPVVLTGFHLIGKNGHQRIAISWLVASSLFFYGWWNPAYLGLILASIIFNYAIGVSLGEKASKLLLGFGIFINLSLLGFFKYANFFVENLNLVLDLQIHLKNIILPLAISFFTFQQIAYLVDAYRGITREYNFLHYCLFVTFFPQLIAGPIVHHKEMLPQFANDMLYKVKSANVSVGITIFMLGLFKKVVLADNVAVYASPVFDAAENGVVLTFFEAWGGALAYSFQLYFDFSGYSDMAIGLARMFGVVLPINFFSPYKATSIIDFWRRWHITLSRFLRDYLYIPLGGNRKGHVRRISNLLITMLLGGIWHGAGWTFLIWGGIHGVYLLINYLWRWLIRKIIPQNSCTSPVMKKFGIFLTFIAVVVAWVMFRAETLEGAMAMYSGMFAYNGISLPVWSEAPLAGVSDFFSKTHFIYNGMFHNTVFGNEAFGYSLLLLLVIIVWFAPNTLEMLRDYHPALGIDSLSSSCKDIMDWKFNAKFASILAVLTLVSLLLMSSPTEFLYFQF